MRNVAVTTCAVLFATAASILAQETFFSESIEVRITNVDVIVTGRDGKPVIGLTKDDFELFEDGVKKEISNFAEIRGGPYAALTQQPGQTPSAATAPQQQDLRRRDVTIFVDNAVLQPNRRNQILPYLQKFIATAVRPGDTVGIVTYARSVKLELEPTSDRNVINSAVNRLMSQTTFGSDEKSRRDEYYRQLSLLVRAFNGKVTLPDAPPAKPPWEMGLNEARSYAQQASYDARQRVEALKSVIAWRRGVEGRKILVLVTAEMSSNPGEEAFLYLDSIRDEFDSPRGSAMMEAPQYRIPGLVEQVIDVANSAGVTIYPIDATGKNANLIEHDASDVTPMSNLGSIPAAASLMPTLQPIALETGGVALSGSDNWQLAFDTISNDLETYYSLGYRSDGPRSDRVRKIVVKLKSKKFNVRTRSGVIEKTVTSEMQDAVAANLFQPSGKNDLAIKVATGARKPEAEKVVVPITITIPLDKLTLVPEGTDLTGRFALYAAFLRNDGAVSKVAQQAQSFRFPANSLKSRKDLKVNLDVSADDRTNVLSVGVMDEMSKATGFASAKLE